MKITTIEVKANNKNLWFLTTIKNVYDPSIEEHQKNMYLEIDEFVDDQELFIEIDEKRKKELQETIKNIHKFIINQELGVKCIEGVDVTLFIETKEEN